MTTAILSQRIVDELKLLGAFTSTVKTNIIRDATMMFCRKMDRPVISATIAVTTSTGPYSIPATIDKLVRIYNNASTPAIASYTTDLTKRQITLLTAPTAAGNYTAYGSPLSIRTNLDAVIAGMSEDYEDVLWAFIRATACRQAGDIDGYAGELKIAYQALDDLRKSINRNLDQNDMPVQFLDVTGQIVSDTANAENLSADIDDYLESDN